MVSFVMVSVGFVVSTLIRYVVGSVVLCCLVQCVRCNALFVRLFASNRGGAFARLVTVSKTFGFENFRVGSYGGASCAVPKLTIRVVVMVY
jgi:hypothetical protein